MEAERSQGFLHQGDLGSRLGELLSFSQKLLAELLVLVGQEGIYGFGYNASQSHFPRVKHLRFWRYCISCASCSSAQCTGIPKFLQNSSHL